MDLKLTGDTTMEVGLVGTGPMARHMAQRLADGGHRVLVFDPRGGAGAPMATRGVTHFASLEALRFELTSPRAWWLALPAQGASEALWGELASLLEPGDTLVDGAESDYRDSQRRAADLAQRRIGFVDCGIRGPMPGEDPGYRMLLGGRTDVIRALRPILETLAPARGRRWGRVGASGAGHFARTQLFGQDLRPMSSHAQNQPLERQRPALALDRCQIARICGHGQEILAVAGLQHMPGLATNPDPAQADPEERNTPADQGCPGNFAVDAAPAAPIWLPSMHQRARRRLDRTPFAGLLAAWRMAAGVPTPIED